MIVLLSLLGLAAATVPMVQTSKGSITGGECPSAAVDFFLGIPYAEPPKRFTAPQAYNGTYNSTYTMQPPSCIQFGTTFLETGPTSEDCLFLNVYRPSGTNSSSQLPVKVWIYGGSDAAGGIADGMYNGCNLATDAVVVTLNYRLGPFGWLSLLSANMTGNYGLQDQLLALQWVQDNVASFGGDPSKVVVFGQSAGAYNTFTLATLDNAPQLMRAAIMESDGGIDFATTAEAETYSQNYIAALGCSNDTVSCLLSKTPAQFNNTYLVNSKAFGVPSADTLVENNGRGDSWGPLVDGVVVKKSPAQTGVKVPSIFGSNTQDGSLFVLSEYKSIDINETEWDNFLTKNFGQYAGVVNQSVSISNFNSTPAPIFYAMSYVITQVGYRCTGYRGALQAVENNIPVWVYSFNHTPSCDYLTSLPNEAKVLELLGPTHTAELPFVWGLVSNLPAGVGNCTLTASEQAMSLWMRNAWTSMAENGYPGESWPAFNGTSSMGINFNDVPDVGVVDFNICAGLFDTLNANISALDAETTAKSNITGNVTSTTTTNNAPVVLGSAFSTFILATIAGFMMIL